MNLSTIQFSQQGALHISGSENRQNGNIINSKNMSVRPSDVRKAHRDRNEMKIREREDILIQKTLDRIMDIKNSDMNFDKRNNIIKSLEEEIETILTQRTDREIERQKFEMKERQAELEKERREREERFKESIPQPKNTEQALQREEIRSMVEISISLDSITTLKRSRARMKMEASNLTQEINGSPTGRANPNDFRNTHLEKLERGIAGLSADIDSELGKINNNTRNWAEFRVNVTQNHDNDSVEEKETDDNEMSVENTNQIIDLKINTTNEIDLSV